MFRLLQSIFGHTGSGKGETEPGDTLIDDAIERVIDGTDPRLRLIRGYRGRIRPSVTRAVTHVIALVDALPPFTELSRRELGSNPLVRALFASPGHLREILGQSISLGQYLEQHRQPIPERIHALLSVQWEEKRILGQELVGDRIRGDVMQTIVYFTNHRLACPSVGKEESLLEMKTLAFDFLVRKALEAVAGYRVEKGESARRRGLLQRKLRTLEAARWGTSPLSDRSSVGSRHRAEVEQEIARLEQELNGLREDPVTLDDYLNIVSNCLEQASGHLRLIDTSLRLNPMGLKVEENAEDAVSLHFKEVVSSDNESEIVLPVVVPVDEIPEQRDLLQEANRYLQ